MTAVGEVIKMQALQQRSHLIDQPINVVSVGQVISKKPEPPAHHRLALLVQLEGDLRKLPSWQATVFHALNEPQALLGHVQAYFFRVDHRGTLHCEAASSVAQVDTRAPFIRVLNTVIGDLSDKAATSAFELSDSLRSAQAVYKHGLWLPMLDGNGRVFGGLLFLRTDIWPDHAKTVSSRLAQAYGHALRVHRPPQLLRLVSLPRWALWTIPVTLALLMLVPVPMTTLAPFEVVTRDPIPVTAPLDGVIAEILPEPNTPVRAGDMLFKLDATELAAAAEVALQRVTIADSRLLTARNGAFADIDMKRSLATLERELALAQSDYDLAKSRLDRSGVIAGASGLLVYSSRNDWLGKPLRVGERVMDIADVNKIAVRVDVGVHDAAALEDGNEIRLFFDGDPLNPRSAKSYEQSYHATERTSGQLTYSVRAALTDEGSDVPHIGLRGTAQLIGRKVPLGFYLFRRPLAALRQQFGF